MCSLTYWITARLRYAFPIASTTLAYSGGPRIDRNNYFLTKTLAYVKKKQYFCTVKSAQCTKTCTFYSANTTIFIYDRRIIIAVHEGAIEAHFHGF